MCKATHDYDANTDDELSFRQGGMLTIINIEGDWFFIDKYLRQGYKGTSKRLKFRVNH